MRKEIPETRMARHQLSTEIEIAATPERVWSILADFAAYPEWNPFIRSVTGSPVQGSRIEIRVQPSGGNGMTFRPTILAAEPGRELRWLGHLFMPGIFDGEHSFVIEPLGAEKVLFRQGEQFRGILLPLFRSTLDRDTKRGFHEMNEALKARAETRETSVKTP
jgi:hypothetical protein